MGWTINHTGLAEHVNVDHDGAGTWTTGANGRTRSVTIQRPTQVVLSGNDSEHRDITVKNTTGTPSDPYISISGNDMSVEGARFEGSPGAVDFIQISSDRSRFSNWWVETNRHGIILDTATRCSLDDMHIECGSQADDTWDGINAVTSDANRITNILVVGSGGANNPRYAVNLTDAASDDNYLCGIHGPDAQTAVINDSGTGTVTCLTGDQDAFDALADGWNGSFVESFDALVTEAAGVITMSLEQTGGGDLTMRFSDGLTVLDCTPADTITLTAGTDAAPQANYIYIPQSTKVLTKSTSAWPTTEHIKVGYFLVPSATFVGANGVYVNQNWNDHAEGSPDDRGHIMHIAEHLRRTGGVYFSGLAGAGTSDYLTLAGTTVDFKMTAGVGYQLHRHTVSAVDTSTGDVVLVKNWSGDAYHDITNLYDIAADSTGAAIGTNQYFNLVVWAVANKTGEYSPVIINLPSGTYNNISDAEGDVSGYDDYSIPREFNIESSVALLVCRLTIRKLVSSWTYHSTVDLRGSTVASASGGAAAVTSFNDANFEVFNNADNTKVVDLDVSGVTTATTRTLTVPDADGTIALTSDVVSDHGGLSGLGDDDHSQYLLVDGSRAMTGTLNLDGNNLDTGEAGGGTDFWRISTAADIAQIILADKTTGASVASFIVCYGPNKATNPGDFLIKSPSDGDTIMSWGESADTLTIAKAVVLSGNTWSTWSPTYSGITVGNGTVTARYIQIGDLVVADWYFELGSTSAVGTPATVSLPVNATHPGLTQMHAGGAWFEDADGADLVGATRIESATTMRAIALATGGTYLQVTGVTSTVPFTWATGDAIHLRAVYEAA